MQFLPKNAVGSDGKASAGPPLIAHHTHPSVMPYRILTLLYVVVAAAMLIFWSGCDPDDDMPAPDFSCAKKIPTINPSKQYCNPTLTPINFRQPQEQPDLPLESYCSEGKEESVRYLRIANQGGNVVLHRYANYPGQFSYDLLSGNCNDGFSSIFCVQEERGVVSVHKIEDVPASSDLIIRIVEEKILYDVEKYEDDRVEFAVFFDVPLNVTTDQSGEQVVNFDCKNSPPSRPSLILSGTDGENIDVDFIAEALGLTIIKQCDCEQQLVELALDVTVDPETAEPRAKATKAKAQTGGELDINFVLGFGDFDNPDYIPSSSSYMVKSGCFVRQLKAPKQSNPLRIAIVDSGIDLQDSELLAYSWDINSDPQCTANFTSLGHDQLGGQYPDDKVGHGSAVTSAVLQAWPEEYPVDVKHYRFMISPDGDLFDATCAIQTAVKSKPAVINLSWGVKYDQPIACLFSAIQAAGNQDVVVVTSAGNNQANISNKPNWPGSFSSTQLPNLLTVGSYAVLDEDYNVTYFSQSSYSPDLVRLAAPYAVQARRLNGSLYYPYGTSISAGYVTGRAAFLRAKNPGLSAIETINELLQYPNAFDSSEFGGLVKNKLGVAPLYGPCGKQSPGGLD